MLIPVEAHRLEKHKTFTLEFFLKITQIKNEFIHLLKIFIKDTASDVPMLEIIGIPKLFLSSRKMSSQESHCTFQCTSCLLH